MRLGARVEVLERGTAHAGHEGLGGRVEDVDDGGAVGADAREGAGVTRGPEHALPLRGHLPEDDVLGLGVAGAHVVLADGPAGADRVGHVGLGDRGVLVELGLAGEVVRRVVDDEVADVGRDGQLHLDVSSDLNVAGVALEVRRALVAGRALRVQRAAVDVHVDQRRVVVTPVELVSPGGDVGVLVARELEHREVDALALAPRADAGRAVERVVLRRRQAAAAGAGAVTEREVDPSDGAEQLLGGGIGRLAVAGRGRLGARAHRVVDAEGVLGIAHRVGQPDHAQGGTRERARHVDGRGVGEVLGALRVLEGIQRGVERALYLGARSGGAHQERRTRRHHGQAAAIQELGHRIAVRRGGRIARVELPARQEVVVGRAVLVVQRGQHAVQPGGVTRGDGHLDLHLRAAVAAGDVVGRRRHAVGERHVAQAGARCRSGGARRSERSRERGDGQSHSGDGTCADRARDHAH